MFGIKYITQVLADKNAKGVMLGAASSSLASISFTVALSVYIMSLTGSAIDLSVTLTFGILPMVFFSLIAGVICDRFNRKKILLLCDLVRVVIGFVFLIALNTLPQASVFVVIYCVVFAFSTIEVFALASFYSITPQVIEKDKLLDFNSLFTALKNAIAIGGPPASIGLYAVFGIHATVVLVIGCYAFSYSVVSRIDYQPQEKLSIVGIGRFVKGELSQCLTLVKSDVRIASAYVNGFTTHLFVFPFVMIGLPYLIIEVFQGLPAEFALVEMAAAAGGVMSVFLVPLTKRLGTSFNIMAGMVGMLLGSLLYIALLHPVFAELLANSGLIRVIFFALSSFVLFISFSFYGVYFMTFMQQTITASQFGKGLAIQLTMASIGRVIGLSFFGVLFTNSLTLAVFALILGMVLKFVIHIPFVLKDRDSQNHLVLEVD